VLEGDTEVELIRKLRVQPGVEQTPEGPAEYMVYRVSPWDTVKGEIAPEGTELRNHAAPFTATLEEKWTGSKEAVAAIGHVNGVRADMWERKALEAAMFGTPIEADLQLSWTNSPTLAVGRANDLREHLMMLSVDRTRVLDLSGVEGGGSTLERGGPARAGLRMIAHVAGEVDKDPSGDLVLDGWSKFGTEQMGDAFFWGESLREAVSLRTRGGLKKAVMIQGGASYLLAATPRWASMCCKCRQRTEDQVGGILDKLYRRELQEQRARTKESMVRLKSRPLARGPRRNRFVIEDELVAEVEKLEAKELGASAAKRRKLTLQMWRELEDAGGQRIVETELAQMEWNGGGGLL
jgi:hypothetical protein